MFMVRNLLRLLFLVAICVVLSVAQNQPDKSSAPDLTKQPTLYVVGYAHLDTQWRWEYPQVIREYLASTLHDNFNLFEKYPHYIFNFSGANRYRLMKEYYPADYAKMKQYVAAGKWFPAGSSMEESDVNSPSAESIFRQVLYGNKYFRGDFGKASAEYMLPDCFGFPASLPSILAHSGIKGFSTQKLTWGSSAPAGGPNSPERTPEGTPFNVGIWEGPDGKSLLAGLNPGSYSADITTDLSKPLPDAGSITPPPNSKMTPEELELRRYQGDWARRVQRNGEVSGLFTDYHYYGTGDIGGSPREPAVKLLEAIITKGEAVLPPPRHSGEEQVPPAPEGAQPLRVGDGPVKVLSTKADQMFLDITPSETAKLPRYKGEMELTNHSAGSLSSETYHKRWNRKNELLADAAEKASIAAAWLGGPSYPFDRLNNAWTLVMGGQFHDIQAGTATPKSYEFSWNDDVIAMNQFASVLTSATQAVASGMATQAKGTPVVVYNPLNIQREDVVEANITFPSGTPKAVRVVGPDGREVPAQLTSGGGTKILFLAKAPSVGYVVYDVQPVDSAPAASTLKVTESSLENARYRVAVNQNGDVSSVFDKSVNKELLSAPIRLAFQTEHPFDWPAWNMDWEDQQKPPRGYVEGPAKVRIAENGPVRVALEVSRQAEDSNFVQTISLAAGDAGNRVEFGNVIDWKAKEAALKATFRLTASNPQATYNWDVGTIQRGNNDPKKFEVASHQWFDLTDKSGAYGVTVLSDCKYGSDKPDDNTLRLTLVYTPGLGGGNGRSYSDQTTQDWGHHEFTFGLAGHRGDWKQAQTDWQGYRLNQPLIAFESSKHPGTLGKTLSLLNVSNSRVRVLAMKKAEQSDDVIVRLVELDGKPAQNVRIGFAGPVTSAREVNGQEEPLGNASVATGAVVANFTPYQLHTFAVKLGASRTKLAAVQSQPVTLSYDQAVATQQQSQSQSGFDGQGHSLPAEMLPTEIAYGGARFNLPPGGDGKPNAVAAKGQTIQLPSGTFNRVYLLAASADGDQKGTFKVGDKSVDLTIQDWGGYIGQWDNRTWNKHQEPVPLRPGAPAPPPGAPPRMRTVLEYTGLTPGFIKRAPLAWYASHHHNPDGTDEPYAYSYLFVYPIDVPANAKTLTLPDNDKIRILAISVANESGQLWPAQPLYDMLERSGSSTAQTTTGTAAQMSKR
jgi:alpha-mannosidase